MDNLGGILGIVVAAGLGAYFRDKHPPKTRLASFLQVGLIVIVAAAAGAAGGIGGRYLRMATGNPSTADVDKAVATVKQAPLLGLVLSENPAVESEMRKTMEAEMKNPRKGGPDRLWQFALDVRQKIIVPALRNATDADATNATNSLRELAVYLQRTNISLCSEFGKKGLQRPDKLGSEGQSIFKRALEAMEAAYRGGKSASPRPQPSDEELGQLLVKAGYNQQDFEMMSKFEQLSDPDACASTVKLYSAPSRLQARDAGFLARYILTITD